MMIFEGVSDPRRTEDSLKLLLKDSDFNSALDEIENSVKLRISNFDVLCALSFCPQFSCLISKKRFHGLGKG